MSYLSTMKLVIYQTVIWMVCGHYCHGLVTSYIQAGQCLNTAAYTMKANYKINACVKDCSLAKHCVAVVYDRALRLCSYFDVEGDTINCAGKYLVLRRNLPTVSKFNKTEHYT